MSEREDLAKRLEWANPGGIAVHDLEWLAVADAAMSWAREQWQQSDSRLVDKIDALTRERDALKDALRQAERDYDDENSRFKPRGGELDRADAEISALKAGRWALVEKAIHAGQLWALGKLPPVSFRDISTEAARIIAEHDAADDGLRISAEAEREIQRENL